MTKQDLPQENKDGSEMKINGCNTPYYQKEGEKNPHDHLINTKKIFFKKLQCTFMREQKTLKKQNRKECPQPDKGHL